MFNETHQFEQKLSGILFLVLEKMAAACAHVPWVIYVFFTYFTTDLGNAAFKLPFPIWYVLV